ncbi:MAG: hypothetical protein K6U00_00955 [Armatimonadetes bacterium]|nr:hypothetical protein [Armatimonadota bacterium]
MQTLLIGLVLACCCNVCVAASPFSYEFTFDEPMSWADDISPRGTSLIQSWEIVDGGNPGKVLRISAAVYEQPVSCEARTLQFNHKSGVSAKVSFDIKAVSNPPGSYLMVRYFDGYCGGMPFVKIADEKTNPATDRFPPPSWDSRHANLADDWQHVEFTTGTLSNTVLTLFFMVEQQRETAGKYVEYLLDNLKVETEPLDKLMDLGFDWHGNYGESTFHWWQNTRGANIDWCDYAEQVSVKDWRGKDIHFTLYQFRDSSASPGPATRHKLGHVNYLRDVGWKGVVQCARIYAGDRSSVSCGVRQTVSYAALGLKPNQTARIQVKMKYTNYEWYNQQMTRVALGVDPTGSVIPSRAIWTSEYYGVIKKDGKWEIGTVEFEKPIGAQAFTIYFRHRDGSGTPAPDPGPHEPQSRGTHFPCMGIADWVTVKVLPEEAKTSTRVSGVRE